MMRVTLDKNLFFLTLPVECSIIKFLRLGYQPSEEKVLNFC